MHLYKYKNMHVCMYTNVMAWSNTMYAEIYIPFIPKCLSTLTFILTLIIRLIKKIKL
jgi:hypothetical protein